MKQRENIAIHTHRHSDRSLSSPETTLPVPGQLFPLRLPLVGMQFH